MRLLLLISFFSLAQIISPLDFAQAETNDHRPFGIVLGAGVSRDWIALKGSDFTSRFEGWGPVVEAGLDLPFSDHYGFSLFAEGRSLDLTNPRSDNRSIEKAASLSAAAKASFFRGPWALGYGLGFDSVKIKQVSVSGGTTESRIRGQSQIYFGSYSLRVRSSLRLSLEGFYKAGNLDNYSTTDAGGTIKLSYLLGSD